MSDARQRRLERSANATGDRDTHQVACARAGHVQPPETIDGQSYICEECCAWVEKPSRWHVIRDGRYTALVFFGQGGVSERLEVRLGAAVSVEDQLQQHTEHRPPAEIVEHLEQAWLGFVDEHHAVKRP